MATYNVDLSPSLVNLGTEGSLDTSVTGGNSIQRTVHGILIVDGTDRKIVGRIADGSTFDDTMDTLLSVPGIS
jgi:hypothetical protein